jgi:putative endonuclease
MAGLDPAIPVTPTALTRAPEMPGGWVYMMTNRRDGVLYLGVTSNMAKRAWEHRTGVVDGFTKRYRLKLLVWTEYHPDIR